MGRPSAVFWYTCICFSLPTVTGTELQTSQQNNHIGYLSANQIANNYYERKFHQQANTEETVFSFVLGMELGLQFQTCSNHTSLVKSTKDILIEISLYNMTRVFLNSYLYFFFFFWTVKKQIYKITNDSTLIRNSSLEII